MKNIASFFLLLATFSALGCTSKHSDVAQSPGLVPVKLMLNWFPEAEHGGFYAAKVHGIFEKYGLEVEILPGGPKAPVAQELVTGRVEFAIGNADDVLLFRQQEAPVVAVMAPMQNTPRCILVRQDSDINNFSDLKGHLLQANKGRAFLDFLQAQGLLDGVQVVPYNGNVSQLVSDRSTAIQAYSFSEPLMASQQGVATRSMMLSDIGFNPYASCLIVTESLIDANPELVSKMVQASCEGWRRYLADPSQTNEYILSQNQFGMTAEALQFGAEQLGKLCRPEGLSENEIGAMSAERWETLVNQLTKLKLIDSAHVSSERVFNLKFLKTEKVD